MGAYSRRGLNQGDRAKSRRGAKSMTHGTTENLKLKDDSYTN